MPLYLLCYNSKKKKKRKEKHLELKGVFQPLYKALIKLLYYLN